jgi:phage tail sheath gpL-like
MAKKTPEEKAQLDDLKAQADAAGIEYGGNIGIDTLAARIDEDAPSNGKMTPEQIAEQEADAIAAIEALDAEALAELTAEAKDRAEAEAEAMQADPQSAPVDADPAKIMVEVNSTNPNPVRLMVNGKRLGNDIWQGEATDVSAEALEALINSAVDFVFIHGQKE